MRVVRAALLLMLIALGCGGGVVIVSFTTGTVAGDPICHGGTGQFDLRQQGGLVVLVVINTGTQVVLPGGFPGTCTDVTAGTHVQVGGKREGDTITARSVNL